MHKRRIKTEQLTKEIEEALDNYQIPHSDVAVFTRKLTDYTQNGYVLEYPHGLSHHQINFFLYNVASTPQHYNVKVIKPIETVYNLVTQYINTTISDEQVVKTIKSIIE